MKPNHVILSVIGAVLLGFASQTPVAKANGCFSDPIYERSGQVKVVIGARVRSVACMEGSTVLKTLPVGRVVFLIGETDGWLKVRDADGTEGWVGATLLAPSDEPITPAVAPIIIPTPIAPSPSVPLVVAETSSTTDWYDQDHSGELSQAAPPGLARANYPSGCYVDPVPAQDFRVKITVGARVRDGACMVGTIVKKTLPVGRVVQVIASTDGWYKVRDTDGVEGWIGATLAVKTNEASSSAASATPATTTQPTKPASGSLTSRVVGHILLQVENHGEAWYVNPSDNKRYYMKDGPTAYEMMRTLSLGINNANFDKLAAHDTSLIQRLKGQIVLKVEDVGKAYYVHPDTGSLHYLKDGAAAYELMRTLSLGITNRDLDGLPSATLIPKASTQSVPPVSTPTPTPAPIQSASPNITVSAHQGGLIPSGIDTVELNRYWLQKINELRAAKNLRQLVLDQRWVDTASEYAEYMGVNHVSNHERADGKTMHQWIDTKGLTFTTRNSPGGWTTNYFTENISWNQIQPNHG